MASSNITKECINPTASEAAGVIVFSPLGGIGIAPFLVRINWLGVLQLVLFLAFWTVFGITLTKIDVQLKTTVDELSNENRVVSVETQDDFFSYAVGSTVLVLVLLIFWAVAIILVWVKIRKCRN